MILLFHFSNATHLTSAEMPTFRNQMRMKSFSEWANQLGSLGALGPPKRIEGEKP